MEPQRENTNDRSPELSDFADLLARNAAFAASFDEGDLPIPPNVKTIILTCVDARVDPAHFLGLELGDALTMRTVGARVTDAAVDEAVLLYWLVKFGSQGAIDLGLAVIGHTDCGMRRLADPETATKFAEKVGSDVVAAYAIGDLAATIRLDIEKITSDLRFPAAMSVSGYIYDVKSGLVRAV